MKKMLSCLLVILCAFSGLRTPVYADELRLSARAYALYCVNNGAFLFSENADEPLPMASTTKVMTALLTLEEAARDNRTVTFTDAMAAEGSSMYLEVGEQVTLYDLAVGMLMQSGNDAANAAAIALSGSFSAFAERMNAKAKALGMHDTCFVTPSGLDAAGHCTTAHDLALLMAAAMENPDFAAITAQTQMTVTFTAPADKRVTYPNHNKLLSLYDGCIGGKTGYTDRAGRCLVTCAERGGLRLIAVTLDAPDDWDDHAALYDEGFARYRVYTPETVRLTAAVVGGTADSVTLGAAQTKAVVLPVGDGDAEPTVQVYLPAFLYAPLKSGEEAGRVRVLYQNDVVAELPLLCDEDVDYDSRPRGLSEYIKDVYLWHNR